MARIRTIEPEFWSDAASESASAAYWLYCIIEDGAIETGPCKIGIATHLDKRLSSLQGGNWRPLLLAWKVRLASRDQAIATEEWLLQRFRPNIYSPNSRESRLRSEWVTARPAQVLATAAEYIELAHEPIRRIA